MRTLIFFLIFFGSPALLAAQTDSVVTQADSILPGPVRAAADTVFKDPARIAIEKMPRQAAIRSAILPGLGQIHNKRWWKVPFIYGGFVAVGLAYEFNQRYYKEFLGEVQYRLEHNNEPKNPNYAGYSFEGMVRVKDTYRRNRDLSILGFFAVHAINIIDAYVDAKLFRYDISDELGFSLQPSLHLADRKSSGMSLFKIKLSL